MVRNVGFAPARPVFQRYLVALLVLSLALVAKLLVTPPQQMESPFLLFFAAVTVSAWYGGLGPGLLVTALAALASIVFFFPPLVAFQVDEPAGLLRIGLFLTEGALISGLSGALHQARHLAEQALAARDEFLHIAAHELKNPLAGLVGYAQLIQRRVPTMGLGERDLRAITSLGDQAARLNCLVNTLLDLSRIQSGGLAVERRPIEVTELVGSFVAQLQPTLERYTLVYTAPSSDIWVLGDALRLEQVLHNLLQNAVKYSPAGGEIVVTVEATSAAVTLTVCDQGIGIPEEDLPHIFERYTRARNSSAGRIAGLGIGLTIVRSLVTAHHGRIAVTSVEGEGSTFTVSLPRLSREAKRMELSTVSS